MAFAGINYLAIVSAAVAGFLFGWAWYAALGKAWFAALGKAPDIKATAMPVGPMIVIFIALLVMAWVLAGVMAHLGSITVRTGMISGAFCWLGFVITTLASNYAFQG